MTLSRVLRQWVCRGLIGLMLFSQLAIATYACPALQTGLGVADAQSVAEAPMGGTSASEAEPVGRMMNCDQMAGTLDKDSANLCAEHCHRGQQSDQVHAPATPAVALISLYVVAPTMPEATLPMSATAVSVDAPAAVSPPHAILHCCIRD